MVCTVQSSQQAARAGLSGTGSSCSLSALPGSSSNKFAFKTFPFCWFFWFCLYLNTLIFMYCFVLFPPLIFLQIAQAEFSGSKAGVLQEGEAGTRIQGWFLFWTPFFQLSPFLPCSAEWPCWGWSRLVPPRTVFKLSKIRLVSHKVKSHISLPWDF